MGSTASSVIDGRNEVAGTAPEQTPTKKQTWHEARSASAGRPGSWRSQSCPRSSSPRSAGECGELPRPSRPVEATGPRRFFRCVLGDASAAREDQCAYAPR